MTETHATAPVFPPGRYGHRRERRRARRWLTATLVGVVVLVGLGLAWRLYRQYGDPTYAAEVTRVTQLSDTGVTVEFRVTVPPGGTAVCTVRARSSAGEEIGRAKVTVRAAAGQRRVVSSYRLVTKGLPRTAEVPGCGPQDR